MEKMESTKKKSGKSSRQSTPGPQESQSVENAENGSSNKIIESKTENQSTSNNTKSIVNGKNKSKKDKGNKATVKENASSVSNGIADVTLNSNGESHADGSPLVADEGNPELIEEESLVPNSEQDNDELFPELVYDENSDNECNFDSSSPDFSPVGRSATRRSQAKIIPTPETPQMTKPDTAETTSSSPLIGQSTECTDRPSSCNSSQPDLIAPSDEKVLKLKEMYSLTPRNESLSSDILTETVIKDADSGKIEFENIVTDSKTEIVVEVTHSKTDKSHKMSPFRRSARISEQYSTIANYSGNNSTQDTEVIGDISSSSPDRSPMVDGTEDSTPNCSQGSSHEENSRKDYSEGLRSIRGRKSYRPKEISLRNLIAQKQKAANSEEQMSAISSVNATVGSETRDTSELSPRWTPLVHSNRKRRQSPGVESLTSTTVESPALILSEGRPDHKESILERPSKRQRLLCYVATPLRSLREKMSSSTPIIGRHTQVHAKITTHNEGLIMPSSDEHKSSHINIEEQMPNVADIVHMKGHDEHKWCLIM